MILKLKGPQGYKKMKPYFGEASSFFVLIIIFIAVSLKSKMIISNGTLALYAMIPMALFCMILMTISHMMGKKLKREDQVSLVFSTTMRNLTIALGIVRGIEGGSLAVFLMALSYMVQLPMTTYYYIYALKKLAVS